MTEYLYHKLSYLYENVFQFRFTFINHITTVSYIKVHEIFLTVKSTDTSHSGPVLYTFCEIIHP